MTFIEHKFYNCEVTTTSGSVYKINADSLHTDKLDFWQNWYCDTGHHRIFIDVDGNIYGGTCKNDHLGHIDTDWQILSKSTICKRNRCVGCTDDLMTAKSKTK
jgi:hypothetical protein